MGLGSQLPQLFQEGDCSVATGAGEGKVLHRVIDQKIDVRPKVASDGSQPTGVIGMIVDLRQLAVLECDLSARLSPVGVTSREEPRQ